MDTNNNNNNSNSHGIHLHKLRKNTLDLGNDNRLCLQQKQSYGNSLRHIHLDVTIGRRKSVDDAE